MNSLMSWNKIEESENIFSIPFFLFLNDWNSFQIYSEKTLFDMYVLSLLLYKLAFRLFFLTCLQNAKNPIQQWSPPAFTPLSPSAGYYSPSQLSLSRHCLCFWLSSVALPTAFLFVCCAEDCFSNYYRYG